MGMFAVAPDGFVSRAQEEQEEAEGIASDLMDDATKISEAAYALYSDAIACAWRCELSRTQLEALRQDMATMCARLEALRDGRAA